MFLRLPQRFGMLGLSLLLTAIAGATPPPTPTQTATSRNVKLTVAMSDFAQAPDGSKPVSGTKQDSNFDIAVTTTPSSEPNWTDCWISNVRISVGGVAIHDQHYDQNASDKRRQITTLRWTTTCFPNDASVTIRLEADAHCIRTYDEGVEQGDVSVAVQTTVKVRNIATLLSTAEDIVGSTYQHNASGNEAVEALACSTVANTALAAMNHSVCGYDGSSHVPLSPAASQDLHENQVLANLSASTVFFACTHGAYAKFRSSWDDGLEANGDDTILSTDILPAARPPGSPKMNMALMFACSTLASNSTALPSAMGLTNAANKAYGGFTETVDVVVFEVDLSGYPLTPHKTHPLSHYVDELFQRLAGGESLWNARYNLEKRLRVVERGWNGISGSVNTHQLKVVGDPASRISGVYTGAMPGGATWSVFCGYLSFIPPVPVPIP